MRIALLASGLLAWAVAAAPAPATAAATDPASLAIVSGAAAPAMLTPQMLAKLPMVQVTVSFQTAQGPFQARFAGPLLWTVLADTAKPRQQAAQTILVTGRDGYAAALAMGEISPDFEDKPVILAESMNGHPLGDDHLRLVVPDDRRGARSVRDVVRIVVSAPAAMTH